MDDQNLNDNIDNTRWVFNEKIPKSVMFSQNYKVNK